VLKSACLKSLPAALIRNLVDAVRVQIKYLLTDDGNEMKPERDDPNIKEIMQSLRAFISD
ncbi:hypothetical protein ACUN9Z_37215, partial [Escherichia sp. HC-CC4]